MKKMQVRITKCVEDDVDSLVAIENSVFEDPWSRNMLLDEILADSSAVLCVRLTQEARMDEIIAYICFMLVYDEVHLNNIAVCEEFRGNGFGELLVNTMFEVCEEMNLKKFTLEVRVSNTSAISLYEKCGYSSAGIRPRYYCKCY